MARRRAVHVPHREFFKAAVIDETIALACTCPRGADHWYAQPQPVEDGAEVEPPDTPTGEDQPG